MNRLERRLGDIRAQGRKALSVFLTAGYPVLDCTEALVLALEKAGVDFFEIGFPFSDPIADGPVIQRSSEIALKNGMNWKRLLQTARAIRKRSQVPLVFMSYANTLFRHTWPGAASQLKDAGFDGAIVPDLIPDTSAEERKAFQAENLSLIYLCAPTSSDARMRAIGEASSGFVYCVSVTGVTGARKALPADDINAFVKRVKKHTQLPAVLGFGISDPTHIDQFRNSADGFVIGSAMARALEAPGTPAELAARAADFIQPFVQKL